jgi:hypothetical protein
MHFEFFKKFIFFLLKNHFQFYEQSANPIKPNPLLNNWFRLGLIVKIYKLDYEPNPMNVEWVG